MKPFNQIIINLVRHDTSPTGLPAYIECHVGAVPKKDRGTLVLDLGNYIHRTFGLHYQMCPEYRHKGTRQTLRWFMSWKDIEPIRANILKAAGKPEGLLKYEHYLPTEFSSLIIQNAQRGVHAPLQGRPDGTS